MKRFLFVFCCLFLSSCTNQYIEFHTQKTQLQNTIEQTQLFSLDQVRDIQDIDIFTTPDENILDIIIDTIAAAQQYVYLEMYILSEKRIQKALLDASSRWIEVKVILEKNVFQAPHVNKKFFQTLQSSGVSVSWNNADPYTLNHSKLLIVDDRVFLSTGNYSHATFAQNREFFLTTIDSDIVSAFVDIFQADFSHTPIHIAHPNILLSPYSSRMIYETLLSSAKKSIHMYAYNFSDTNIRDLLIAQHQNWVDVRIIMPSIKKVSSNSPIIADLQHAGIDVVTIEKPAIHAKGVLIDGTYAAIWSINFSPYSLDENREMGIIYTNQEIITRFLDIFENDLGNHLR